MDDFRNEYQGGKKHGNGWVIVLTCFSVLALIFSSVSLYKSNQISGGQSQSNSNSVGIQVASTAGNTDSSSGNSAGTGVTGVAEAMDGKVVYIATYGTSTNGFSSSVQYAQISSGSGFIVASQGYIVTNYHVVEGGKSFKVTVNKDEVYDASLVGYDSYSDLAVLKIEGANKEFSPVVIGDSNSVKVGELAIAIGSPLGSALSNSVTVGYISATDREITVNSHTSKMIQTDAAINPGNSGGPLLNSSGQVIGINALKSVYAGYDSSGNTISADGISFAIPISDAMPIITQIIETGKYQRPGIGISYYPVDSETSSKNNIPQGLLVRNVNDASPASRAGIQVDDIIVAIDGKEIKSSTDMNGVLDSKKVGDKIKITVYRNGKNVDLDLTLGDLNEMSSTSTTQQTTQPTQDNNKKGGGSWSWPF